MKFFAKLFLFLSLFLIFWNGHASEDPSNLRQQSNDCDGNFIIISTIDGMLTALDLENGRVCWTTLIDNDKFVSSSLSELEVYDKGYRVFLVPSLDGALFKYDVINKVIQPLPIDVDALINHSAYLDSSTSVFGGKNKIILGIHRYTGEVLFKCKIDNCETFKEAEDVVIVEEIIQNINAIDSRKGEKRWHFRVVELKMKIPSKDYDASNTSFKSDDKALIPKSFQSFSDLSNYKVSLHNGFAAKINGSNEDYSWLFQTTAAITDVFYLKENNIKVLDPFGKDSGFFSTLTGDKKHSALLFLGLYKNQMFIKKSRHFKVEDMIFDRKSVSTNILSKNPSPVCPQPQGIVSVQNLKPNVTDLLPNYMEFNESDHGFYFYLNYSIAENATHCIINNSYIVKFDSYFHLNHWLSIYLILFGSAFLVFFTMFTSIEKKQFVTETSPQDMINGSIDNAKNNEMLQFMEFTSRFYQDFDIISVLGKGGFGVVMDVKNKIDDCRYAVKRICLQEELTNSQYEKVLREVKALAKLDHHGIVRYFNAWIEYPPIGWQEIKDTEANISDVTTNSSESYSKESSMKLKLSKICDVAEPNSFNIRKRLNVNPFNPFNNDFPEFISNGPESKLSDDGNNSSHSSCSSDQTEENNSIEKNKSSVESSWGSDSSILFTNNENLFNSQNKSNKDMAKSYEDDDYKFHINSDEDFSSKEHNSKRSFCDMKDPSQKKENCTASVTESSGRKEPIALRSRKESEVAKGYLYIQMQLCQKESLRDWLNRHSDNREYDKVMEIFAEIVDAVHYVHNCGLMHRDLKPSNIYFSLEGAIKIGDFGLATSSDNDKEVSASNNQLSDIHTSDVGTEFYMSPEQKLDKDYDSKTDIYSLGIILFELLVPFQTHFERSVMLMRVRRLNFPEEFKRRFQNESKFLQLLLCIDPKERPTTNEIKQHPLLFKYGSPSK